MEEKQVTYTLFNVNNEDGNTINISSDVDDIPDYLTLEDKTALLAHTLQELADNVITESIGNDENVDDDNLDDMVHQMKYSFTLSIVTLIVNTIDTVFAERFTKHPKQLEVCLQTYAKGFPPEIAEELGVDAPDEHHLVDAFYSEELNLMTPVQGTLKFIVDAVDILKDSGISKSVVKKDLEELLDIIKEYIDDTLKQSYEE